ncbi:hypothetical protein HYPDE_26893 [Hyphomicrobium denitrificans 1NES1]|uniref:Uncharacterized protein n=1 Tax=Hyphomicrobium denitrificans 1NES1 TaxID=670307 RepID=N0B0T5_9HYPH|nr:hypothetical protein [Hyphomicrobium denitrificans]AGK57059.1 hypothetical protein HYPDE_26893 [Hyphomicrobium denitrificans 1NES1]
MAPGDYFIEAVGAIGFCVFLFLVLTALNYRRDNQYWLLANKYGLRFERPDLPRENKKNTEYSIRRLTGTYQGNAVIIEDIAKQSFGVSWLPAPPGNAPIFPPPVFSIVMTGLFITVNTHISINGVAVLAYPSKTVNYLLPIREIERMLSSD